MKIHKMQIKESSLVFFTSSLFVVLTGQPSLAFSLTYSNQISEAYNNKASSSFVGDIFGEEGATITNPLEMILVPQNNVTTPFLKKLQKDFGGWDFNFAQTDLSGSFDMQYYYACGNKTLCGKGLSIPGTLSSPIASSKEGVGSAIQLDYIPSGNDTPQSNILHWIQWVVACEKVNIDGTCAVNEQSFIDVQPTNNSPPYYDTNSLGAGYYFDPTTKQGQKFFIDRPYRPDGEQISLSWSAELYLVKAIGGKKVEILNGIKWGWKNTYTPPRNLKTFSGTLASDYQTDTYKLDQLTPAQNIQPGQTTTSLQIDAIPTPV